MKKLYLLIITAAFAFSLSACNSSDYQDALSAMAQGNYEAAYEVFQSIPEYQDSSELAAECVYRMAAEAMNREDYAAARGLLSEIPEYKDASQKAEECSLQMGYQAAFAMKEEIAWAVAQRDEAQLCQLIQGYLTMEHGHEEISAHMNDYVMETIRLQFETPDYENYLFLDRLLALCREDEALTANIGTRLSEFDAASGRQRTIAFLTGTWRRIDSTQVSGLRIRVYCTEENIFAMVLEDFSYRSKKVTKAKFHWDRGMVIWNDIQITDSDYVNMDIMRLTSYYNLGVQSNRFELGMGCLDYAGMRILTQTTKEDTISWQDHLETHIYVKESAIQEVPALRENDFVVSFREENAQFGGKTADLNTWFSGQNKLFCAYSGANELTTARGISIGSDWLEVVEQYGYGRGNLYVEADDTLHANLKDAYRKDGASGKLLCDILSAQADEFMDYTLSDTNQTLRFYFQDGKVSWICFFTE